MGNERKTTEAMRRAISKYQSKFKQMKFWLEPEFYEELKAYCESKGESMASLVKRLITEEIAKNPGKQKKEQHGRIKEDSVLCANGKRLASDI